MRHAFIAFIFGLIALAGPPIRTASAFELAGKKQLALTTNDGKTIPIGSVTFTPKGDKVGFAVDVDTSNFKTYFLSMRDFKCLQGAELECYVPYPYKTPGTVTAADLAWLAHSLLFFYKKPSTYGAPLGNGIYYDLKMTDHGIEGAPEAIDLNVIASPPQDPNVPPYDKESRTPFEGNARWIAKLTITDPPSR